MATQNAGSKGNTTLEISDGGGSGGFTLALRAYNRSLRRTAKISEQVDRLRTALDVAQSLGLDDRREVLETKLQKAVELQKRLSRSSQEAHERWRRSISQPGAEISGPEISGPDGEQESDI